MGRDQRLVQTAVMGSAESEIPALLPMQADLAAAFRQAHAGQTFWRGQWLGGCRGRLTIRMPVGRVAHFAHLRGPEHMACRRTSVGVSGADHLYIKQQFLAWLAGQGIAAAARLPEDAERVGGEVVFEPGGHGCLRVLLDHEAVLPEPVDGTQLVLGPHVAHDPHRLVVDGYVLRIRCDTDGSGRRVMIGTQLHGRTEWVGLDECHLTPLGLCTPAVEEVRRLRTSSRAAFPHRAAPARVDAVVRPVAAPQATGDRSQAFAALRKAVEGERTFSELRHFLTQAEAAARGGASAEENQLLRRAADLLLAKERGVGISAPSAPPPRRGGVSRAGRTGRSRAGQAAEAVADLLDTLDRRNGRLHPGELRRLVAQLKARAEEAGPWLTRQQRRQIAVWEERTGKAPAPAPPPAPARRVTIVQSAAMEAEAPARPAAAGQRTRGGPHRPPAPAGVPTDVDAVADAARDVLEHAARLGTTIPWDRLCAQVKGLAELSEQQRQALKAASRSRSATVLAALITTGSGTPHPHSRRLAGVADVHASFRPSSPPRGARPGGHAT
ncbi:competence protein CoiA family protein [Streptomyces sp. NPDC007162]|uniref:competence protein CoiA family protein n=1 Tax=Streptomyces sp. NPDC007162 TaxID=3156917 RepID=UPI0033E2E9E0